MFNSPGTWVKVLLVGLLASALAYGGSIVGGWHKDSQALEEIKPEHAQLAREKKELDANVQRLTQEGEKLRKSIDEQNHAVELAQEQARSAKEQQELAKSYAAQTARQAASRIASLEADLADSTKTLTDLLDNSWRQAR